MMLTTHVLTVGCGLEDKLRHLWSDKRVVLELDY